MNRDIDQALNELALAQYGAVARWQSRALGVDPHALRRRLSWTTWHEATDRVIVSSSCPASFEQRAAIAHLDAGPGAMLSAITVLHIFEIPGFLDTPIHVSRPRRNAHKPPDEVVWHHPRLLPAHHGLVVNGLRVTTPARAFADTSGLEEIHFKRAERAIDTGLAKGIVTRPQLDQMASEWCEHGRQGSAFLREYLESRPKDWVPPASNVARRFVELIRDAGMPEPRSEVNVGDAVAWLGRVDCLDPVLPLIAEIDSDRFHIAPLDAASDERRDEEMNEAGFHVVRFPEQQVWYEPQVAVERWRKKRNELIAIRRATPPGA